MSEWSLLVWNVEDGICQSPFPIYLVRISCSSILLFAIEQEPECWTKFRSFVLLQVSSICVSFFMQLSQPRASFGSSCSASRVWICENLFDAANHFIRFPIADNIFWDIYCRIFFWGTDNIACNFYSATSSNSGYCTSLFSDFVIYNENLVMVILT